MAEPENAPEGDDEDEGAKDRRWFLRVAGGAAVLAAAYGTSRVAFRLWMQEAVPDDAPRIAFSLDDTWLNEIGVTDTTYQQAMTRAGGRLVRVTPTSGSEHGSVGDMLDAERIDAVLLTGGGDVDPDIYGGEAGEGFLVNRGRDNFELALIEAAVHRGLPILGICRGIQILNVAYGGTLQNLREDEALNDAHFTFSGHDVAIEPDSLLHGIMNIDTLTDALSFHGQGLDRIGAMVRVAATGPEGIVEAIECGETGLDWIVGVQWHPEMEPLNPTHDRLFEAFVAKAIEHRIRKTQPEEESNGEIG